MRPLLILCLCLAACATAAPDPWRAYDAGLARLWVSSHAEVDRVCRLRGAGVGREDLLRGCADFCTGELFSIDDPGVIAHEVWHFAYQTTAETNTACRINRPGEGPR